MARFQLGQGLAIFDTQTGALVCLPPGQYDVVDYAAWPENARRIVALLNLHADAPTANLEYALTQKQHLTS